MPDNSGRERPSFDGRRTGWTIEDIVEECHEWDDNPYRQTYYTTYSDVYHTNPECPHIADSERLHYAFSILDLDGHPWGMGCNRFAHEMEECSWCQNSQPEGKYLKEWYRDTEREHGDSAND